MVGAEEKQALIATAADAALSGAVVNTHSSSTVKKARGRPKKAKTATSAPTPDSTTLELPKLPQQTIQIAPDFVGVDANGAPIIINKHLMPRAKIDADGWVSGFCTFTLKLYKWHINDLKTFLKGIKDKSPKVSFKVTIEDASCGYVETFSQKLNQDVCLTILQPLSTLQRQVKEALGGLWMPAFSDVGQAIDASARLTVNSQGARPTTEFNPRDFGQDNTGSHIIETGNGFRI